MCGIFAAISFDTIKSEEIDLYKKLTDIVQYRGPDDCGYFVDEKVFLGHRRLSILDLSPLGKQPMEKKNSIIVYNGELFNYKEMKNKIKVNYFSNTDTEVILEAYLRYGVEIFCEFNGMWAFVIYDKERKKIIVSRDRFSIKPLYYYIDNSKNMIYFSSEIKQLLPLLKKKEPNEKIIYNFLAQALLDFNNETFYKDIYKFPAGETWIIDLRKSKIDKKKYWNFIPNEYTNIGEDDAVEIFRELLLDSIKVRLRSDVKVGILLSGGLDSSSITSIAKNHYVDDLETFSVVSNVSKYSEDKYIDLLVKFLNIKNTKIYINYEDIISHLSKTLYHMDEPFASFSVVAQNILFEKISQSSESKVLLSGQGGDEILGGYLKYFFFFLKENLKNRRVDVVLKTIIKSILYRTVIYQVSLKEAKRYLPFLQNRSIFDSIFRRKFKKEPIWDVSSFKERQLKDVLYYSVPALTHYEDRNSMAYSCEVRHPFLDHRLVGFCINLPNSLKVKDGWLKYILRKSIKELPKELAWRKDKQGFITPQEFWMKKYMVHEILNIFRENAVLYEMGLIDKDRCLSLINNFFNQNISILNSSDIFRLYITEIWLRENFVFGRKDENNISSWG